MGSAPTEVVFSLSSDQDQGNGQKEGLFYYSNGSVKVPGPWKRGRPKGSANKIRQSPSSNESGLTPLSFRFVNMTQDAPDVDEKSRALIRRHAKLSQFHRMESQNQSINSHKAARIRNFTEVERLTLQSHFNLCQIQGVDQFGIMPFKFEAYMHDLLLHHTTVIWKNFYSLENMVGCNPMLEYWVPLAFQDSALMHCILACSEVYISGYATIQDRKRGLRHLQAAISIVNRRLSSGKDMRSPTTLSVIASLAFLEKGSGRHDYWHIHMQGLKQLVEDRGGIESLYSDPLVLNKLYRCETLVNFGRIGKEIRTDKVADSADLYGSLDAAEPPFFDRPLPLFSGASLARPPKSEGFRLISQIINLDTTLRSCVHHLEDVLLFLSEFGTPPLAAGPSSTTPNPAPKQKPGASEAARIRYLLMTIQYTLITSKADYLDAHESQSLELCRITLILFSLTILNERPASSDSGHQVTNTFRRILTIIMSQSRHDQQDASGQQPIASFRLPLPTSFYLWAIFVAANVVRTTQSDTKDWLIMSFMEFAVPYHSDICDLESLRACLRQYIWLSLIHDPMSEWMWSELVEIRQEQWYT